MPHVSLILRDVGIPPFMQDVPSVLLWSSVWETSAGRRDSGRASPLPSEKSAAPIVRCLLGERCRTDSPPA